MSDFKLIYHGSVVTITPQTDAAQEWIDENIEPGASFFGRALGVEPRYVDPILIGIASAGLTYA